MIHYQYIHTSDGYEKKLNIPQEHADYEYGMNIFETLRTSIEGHSFTYAILEGKNYSILKSGSQNNQAYLEGVFEELHSLNFQPVRFVDGFRVATTNMQLQASVVPTSNLTPSLSLATNLHHFFGKMIDALLYGDPQKQIIIVADNDEAIKYFKVISMILPISYIKNIGFSYGCTSIPNSQYDIQRGATVVPMNIRIVIPEIKDFNFEYYSNTSYVFDMRGQGKDNYDNSLHSIGKLFQELDFGKTTICDNYIQKIKRAFNDDGSVNHELLERIAALAIFEIKNDLPTARDILKTHPDEEDIVLKSLNVMLKEENKASLTSDDRGLIAKSYFNNSAIASSIEEKYCTFLTSLYRSLSLDEKNALYSIIASKEDGSRLEKLLESIRYLDYQAINDAFNVTVEVFKSFIRNNGADVNLLKNFLYVAVEAFSIKQFIKKVPIDQKTQGELFFDRISKESDSKLRILLTSILMASVYKANTSNGELEVRIRGLKKLSDHLDSVIDKIAFVSSVKLELDEIDMMIPEIGLETPFDFVFNHNFGKQWIQGVINDASLPELLKIYEIVHLQTQDGYESLLNCILDKLLNLSYVRANVISGQETYEDYKKFYNHVLPQDVREKHLDISSYLDGLKFEQDINDEFAKYRYDFAYDCYKTLSNSNQKKIDSNVGVDVSTYGAMPKEKRVNVVEHTIDEFGTQDQAPKGKGKKRKPFALWAFGFGVLSGILLILPAIIQALVLNQNDITQIVGSMNPIYAIMPLYVFLLHISSYGCLKVRDTLKRANIITILCGILPVLVFVIAQIVFYYIGIKIDLTFLK